MYAGITSIDLAKLEPGHVYGEWYDLLGLPPDNKCYGRVYFLMQLSAHPEVRPNLIAHAALLLARPRAH